MSPWARGSELDRAVACPGSTHLPRVPDSPGDAAAWGTLLHHWAEHGKPPKGTPASSRKALERRVAALTSSGQTREDLWPGGEHEVTWALHTGSHLVDRVRLPDPKARDAWCQAHGPDWVTGTSDFVGDLFGSPWVDDLKTGREVPAPWDLWQLRFYAVCAVIWTQADQVHVSLTHWPRALIDIPPARTWHTVTRTELLGLTLPLLEMARRRHVDSLSAGPYTVPGAHCAWCRCAPHCPTPDPGARFKEHV